MMTLRASFVLLIVAVIDLAIASSNTIELPVEIYWKKKVGNIPMPKSLKSSLQLGSNDGIVKLNPYYKQSSMNLDSNDCKKEYAQLAKDDCVYVWGSGCEKSQIPQDGRLVYFNNQSLQVGTTMKLRFETIDSKAKFLPLHLAKLMSNSTNKLQVIQNFVYIDPKSSLAEVIEITLKTCEKKGIKDEERYCAISLKDMINYVTASLDAGKKKLSVLSTEQDNDILMQYTIEKVRKLGIDDNHIMVCHKMINPYAVFLCHNIKNTEIYDVSLVGNDEKKTKVVAVCHKDTSSWNPRHYAFEFLNTQPGGIPICHFVSADSIAWFLN